MTSIGRSSLFDGELTTTEDLVIDGEIRGRVHVKDATLTISPEGIAKADIRGARIVVHGRVEGSIVATERIELVPGCTVSGSLSANRVIIADGARFNGRIDMDQRTIAARLAQYKAEHGTPATAT